MLSIVIPTFDRAANLSLALKALAGQSEKDFEVVIADDGSSDETRAVVAGAAADGLPIRYVHCGPNRGVRTGRARNFGAANVDPHATHMLMFDSDLIVPPGFTAEYRRHLTDTSVVLLGRVDWLAPTEHGSLVRWMEDDDWLAIARRVPAGQPVKQQGTFTGREIRCDVAEVPANAWRDPVVPLPYRASLSLPLNACYPLDLFWQAGGFDEDIQGYGYQDMIFGAKVAQLAPACRALGTVAAYHVWHPKSVPERFELEAQCNLDALIRRVGRPDAFADQVDWRLWWHYAADRGGTVEVESDGALWAVNYDRSNRLRLDAAERWQLRLDLMPRSAAADLPGIPNAGTAHATAVDPIVLARKRAAACDTAQR